MANYSLIYLTILIVIMLAVILGRTKKTANQMIYNRQNRKRRKIPFSKQAVFDFLQKEGCCPKMDESDVLFTFNNHRYIAKFDDSDTEFCILLVFMEFENMNREYCEYITATLNGNIKLIQTEIVDEGVIGRIEFYADSLGYFTHNINRFIDIIDYTFGVITEEYRTISEKERISAAIKKNKGTSSSKPIN